MKHTFVLIDKLIILLKDVPRSLDTEDDKEKAREIVNKLIKYSESLIRLIDNHKEEEYLNRLHQSYIAEVEEWANKVETLFGKFESLLKIIESDVKLLKHIIENEPGRWQSAVSDMAFGMVMTGLHDEEEEMERFRRIAIFQEHELREIIELEEHVAELLE